MKELKYEIQFYTLFFLMSPYWGIQTIIRKIRQYHYVRTFTWEKYWANRDKTKE